MSNLAENQEIKVGIFSNIPNKDYHAGPEISSSGLCELNRSPAHYMYFKMNPRQETPALALGTATHMAIFEPQLFEKGYVLAPEGIDRRTKVGKAAFEDFEKANVGKQTLTKEEFQNIEGMREAIYKHPTASKLVVGGEAEQSVYWKDPVTGLMCRCRPDYLRTDNIIIDLKTTHNASLGEFRRSIGKYSYHIKSAHYLDGIGTVVGKVLSDFVHLAVESSAPYCIGIFTLDDASLARGSDEVRRLMDVYHECLMADKWPGYPEEIQNISIPNYLMGAS
jgi:hypothetical protein